MLMKLPLSTPYFYDINSEEPLDNETLERWIGNDFSTNGEEKKKKMMN